MTSPEPLPTAIRAWTERKERRDRRKEKQGVRALPSFALILDTETRTDASHELMFGSYRYCRLAAAGQAIEVNCVEEGLFHADNLPDTDPDGFANLTQYAEDHEADVIPDVPSKLRLMSRTEFVNRVFYDEAFRKRSLIVGFNLPFDVSRLAVSWGMARGRFLGGISLKLWDYRAPDGTRRENSYRPRLAIKSIDSKRALKGFTRPVSVDAIDQIREGREGRGPDPTYTFRGHFLDLRTLAFALTDRSHSLESAGLAFGIEGGKQAAEEHGRISPEYIDYNRRDVQATANLLGKTLEEYGRHPVGLQATKAYSPASIGKAYMQAMGVKPRLELQPEFPPEVLGRAMASYFGGRAECRIRRHVVPVVYVDFLSMYPTVNALMGLWPFHIAERIETVEATEEVRALLSRTTLCDWFDPGGWPALTALVEIEPRGDVLPVRAEYTQGGQTRQIGVNPFYAERAWYTLADVVASTLLTGRPPKVLRAIRLVAHGIQKGLRHIRLRGEVSVDPSQEDLFRIAIERRHALAKKADVPTAEAVRLGSFLKVFANATSYGINAEMNRRELPKGASERMTVYGGGLAVETDVSAPEEPGLFCFPPLAAITTGAARLMLAMLEASVAEFGGTYVACDTDSMLVVATEQGGPVPCPGGTMRVEGIDYVAALTWDQVEEIRARFAGLCPYGCEVDARDLLKLEPENFSAEGEQLQLYALSISAKRYALFNVAADGRAVLRKGSEHGLGHVLAPSGSADWIGESWEWIVTEHLKANPLGWTSPPFRESA